MSGLDENEEELSKLSSGVQMLIYGMVGWLSVVTVAAICIFIGVYLRMSRMARSLDDAETGSSISSKSSRSVSSTTATLTEISHTDRFLVLFVVNFRLRRAVVIVKKQRWGYCDLQFGPLSAVAGP